MKRKIVTLLLAMSVASTLSLSALAAEETKINGFYDIGTQQSVEITPFAENTQVSATEKNLNDDGVLEQVYENSNRLEVTYSKAANSEYYGVILVEGSGLPTKDTEIYYIDQETAGSTDINFNVYPKLPEATTDMTLYISSSAADFNLVSVPVSYAVNAVEVPEEHEHVYGDWETDGEETHSKKCECEDVVTKPHEWDDGEVTTEPTVTDEGVMTYTCTVCGDTKTEAIDKLVDPESVTNITIGDVTARAGNEILVPVAVSNNVGLTGLQIDVEYDEILTLTEIVDGDALTGLTLTKPGDLTANPLTFLWDGMDADNTNGNIVVLKFTVAETAEVGEYEIAAAIKIACDQDLEDVDVYVNNGTVTVIKCTPGDVDDNTEINAKDVILIRRHITGGYGVEIIEDAADVDANDEINAKDVILMRRYITGGYGVELK